MKWAAVIAMLMTLVATDASAAFRDGLAAMVRRDYDAALAHFGEAARAGDVRAQFNLGYMYRRGNGVAKDPVRAARWYRMAADQGHVVAQYVLGTMAETGDGLPEDPETAAMWYRRAAAAGHTQAQFLIGRRYVEGDGVPQDPVEGFVWLSIAAAQGHVLAVEQRDLLAPSLNAEDRAAADPRIAEWLAAQQALIAQMARPARPPRDDLPMPETKEGIVPPYSGPRLPGAPGATDFLPRADLETISRYYGPRGAFHGVHTDLDQINGFQDASRFDLESRARHFAPSRYSRSPASTLRRR